MKKISFEEKYNVLSTKNTLYEGLFITAVKSTGIFCRPSCRAKKPKPENVIFYDKAEDAIKNGFRPCKICKPMEKKGETPEYINKIIRELQENPYFKIKDYNLREKGIEPSQIRRWFKKNHNMTFHAYQRMLRINNAYSQIKDGSSITETAFDAGYNSISGFNEGIKNIFGDSPKKIKDKIVINIVRFTTKLGPMYACATEKGLCLLEFTDRRMLETEFKDICKRMNGVILPGNNKFTDQAIKEMEEYFDGKRKTFSAKLHTPGTEFQQLVWNELQNIPYGKTISYLGEAKKLSRPKSVRAVANANGQNRIAIIIPCHRVIGSDGSLTGYGGGLGRKKWLIDFEKENTILS